VEAEFQIFVILLAVLAGTALLARRTNIAPAILLLLAGVALAFVPGMPSLELPPELVLLVVLPPLIYSASVAMSWREFKHNLRSIILLAVGCVIFTAFAVAAATHYVWPRWRSHASSGCRAASLWCSRARAWRTTPPR
jgi:NhaP-type Na+/H+ or K+/H+ antiporter